MTFFSFGLKSIDSFIEETQLELISINNNRLNVFTFVEMPSFSEC